MKKDPNYNLEHVNMQGVENSLYLIIIKVLNKKP